MHPPFISATRRCSRLAKPVLYTLLLLGLGWHGGAASPTHAAPVTVGALGHSLPDLDTGTLLLGELNCTACHEPRAQASARLIPRPSPRLGAQGLALTPQGLREFLTDPQAAKPGTPMPDLLHGIADRAETVDALVHFLASIQPSSTEPPPAANDFTLQRGRILYHRVGCIACHEPQEPAFSAAGEIVDALNHSIPLGNLARKTTVNALTAFLMDPLKSRPSGRMPSFNLDKGEATAIAVYLLRQQAGVGNPNRPAVPIKGLEFDYFEEQFGSATQLDHATPRASGVVPQFSLQPRKRDQQIGLRFTGSIQIRTEGEYTFFAHSDDGTLLWIDGNMVVNNDGDHGGTERSGSIRLSAGQHAIRVAYYNNGGPFELRISYAGPGVNKQEIPADVLTHFGQPMTPLDEESFTMDPAKVERGRALFGSLGCAACHETAVIAKTPLPAKPLDQLRPEAAGGCLQGPQRGRPAYALSATQTDAITKTLAAGFAEAWAPNQKVRHTMAALNCFACHSRDGVGGPEPARAAYFTSLEDVDLGDEGRLPPHLTGVGAKLKADWLRQVLQGKDKVRPYMATRMPFFGSQYVDPLPGLFIQADGGQTEARTAPAELADAKAGRKLVGTTGLSCITCHTFGSYASLGVPAMDLTLMSKRLREDWFRRYLREPASLRPGTRMPSFWPEGKAANDAILEGNTDAQIQSIWAFLEKGSTGGLPPGLIQGREELSVADEAVIYRHFIAGAGSRAIGVGYPEKVNLAFDANDMRLALIWQGAFIDAAKHRSGRGAGSEQPLGYNVIRMPPGPAFARLSDPAAPWPSAAGKEGGFQLRGYRLDPQRRPAFLYSFQDIEVEDYPVDRTGELDGILRRTLTLRSEAQPDNLWFRAWVGAKIEVRENDTFAVEDTLTLRISGGATQVRRVDNRSELLVQVRFVDGRATLIEDLIW